MNLVAYDLIKGINRNATWIDIRYKKLYSREIPFKEYYAFSKTYNNIKGDYDLCLILSDVNPDNNSFIKVTDKYKPLKIPLHRIWNDISLKVTTTSNIKLKLIEKDSDCDIYLIDI